MKGVPDNGNNYIVLPALTMQAASVGESPDVENFLVSISGNTGQARPLKLGVLNSVKQRSQSIQLKVIDSIHENGAKLVHLSDNDMANFHFSYPGLRIIPEKFYFTSLAPKQEIKSKRSRFAVATTANKAKTATLHKTQLIIKDANTGAPVSSIRIVAFTDFANKTGDEGETSVQGKLTLTLSANTIERLYIYPEHSYWGLYKTSIPVHPKLELKLLPIDLAYQDSLRFFAGKKTETKITTALRVAIIDTGVGPHRDLASVGGMNMVRTENPAEYTDNGEGHGTHVAGIVGAFGNIKGLAGGVEILSYRVFPKFEKGVEIGASNFDIMKAIDKAVEDKCDLINLSLGGSGQDEAIISSVKSAYNAGILCFAANGNDGRQPVCFPAAYSLSIAVSAMGRKGTFPQDAVQLSNISSPYGKDKDNFLAAFSNVGPETDLTAPGVGIISTYPKDLYAIMDGTSMACPAATGMAARLLSARPDILNMPRNQARADEMMKFLSTNTKFMGFGATFEGKGMLV